MDADRRERDAGHAVEEGVQLEPRQAHLHPRGDEVEHRPVVDPEAAQAGEGGRGEMAVVAEDVEALAVVAGAEDRLDALRAQHVELGLGRPGDDHALLAVPDGDGRIAKDRLQAARENGDPRIGLRPRGSGELQGDPPDR